MTATEPRTLAVDYLLATRVGGEWLPVLEWRLAELGADELTNALADDASRIAFWVDIYNAAVVRMGVSGLSEPGGRLFYFRRPAVTIAGRDLSLDAIEHGILRRSRYKLSLGYLTNPRPGAFERRHRVDVVDPRIHFALNCGAASCPPIAAYRHEQLDQQLDIATRGYLAAELERRDGTLFVPSLMLWYLADFGGPPGLRRFLRRHGVEDAGRPIRFKRYDWTPTPDNWSAEEG
jgi:hypothetical protein